MSDAREYMQVLLRQENDDGVTLYLKDKRNGCLCVEGHDRIAPNRSLLHPDSKAPRFSFPITQEEVDIALKQQHGGVE